MYGYVYELYFDSAWIDVSALVHTKNAKVTFNAFGSNLQGSRDVSTITLMHGHDPRKSLAFHSDIYRRLLEAKNNRSVVKFRLLHGTDPVFTGNVDLGNLKQSTGSIPEQISLEIEDNSYLLDNSIEQSFEYPSDAIVDSSGNILADPIFAKADPANSILVKLVMMAGYSPSDIDFTGSNDVKVGDSLARIRLVYDAEEKRTYRDLLDTLLMEYRYVLTNNADGKFCIKRTFVTEEQEAPEIPEYLIKDKITSAGGDYQKDGAAVKWSTLEHSKDMTVYQGSMTPTFDENGLKVDDGEEVDAEGYWPETGDIEEVWFEFDTKFLDRPYLTKKSRLKNKDLSLITTRNIQYEIDADPEISEVTEIRQLLPKKARLLFYNSAIISKYIRGFNMIGDVLYRKKISTYTSPETAKNPEEYESEFLFDSEAADQLASHIFLMHNYGDMTYTWTQKTNINILDLVTVKIPGTSVATKALVKSVTKTFPTAGHMFCKVTAIGVSVFNLLPSKKVAWMNGSGAKGEKGETLIHQYAVGDDGEVPPTFIAVLDADGNPLGYNSDAVGFMDEWSTSKPSVPVDKYLWHRYRYPSDNEWTYVIETRPVASNAPYIKYAYLSSTEVPSTPSGDSSTIPTGWSTEPPARVSGEVIYVITSQVSWSSTNEAVYGTWSVPTAWSGDKGEDGAPARAITIQADSTVINMSSRGDLKTQEIEITCVPSNLPIESAVWTATDAGSLSQIEIAEGVYDPYKRILDCSLVSGDSTLITVSITYGGETYTGVVGITKVADGTPTPMYLEARNEVPELTPEGPLVVGDYFLYVGEYSGPNSDPGDQGLNPPQAETNEFIYGRIYEYKGKDSVGVDQWDESRKSEHFAAAQKDALEIAKNSGVYLYVAVVVAQLGLFMDLIFSGSLMSADYKEYTSAQIGTVVDEHLVTEEDVALKRPYKGIYMDGNKGLIKLLSLMVKDIDAFGFLTSSGFKTLRGEDGQTIGVADPIVPTLWKHSEMEALIASQDTLATLSGTIEGFSFTKATRRSNQRVLLASHGYESESISAGETHLFTTLYPSLIFGRDFYCKYKGAYSGYKSNRSYWANGGVLQSFKDAMGESYTVAKTYPLSAEHNETGFYIVHSSNALWGTQGSHVDYHQVWTNQVFTGLVLVNGETSFKVIEPEPSAYYSNSKTWTIGSYNQNSIDNYCSGTDFYNLFSDLAVGADGFCDGGQIRVNGTLYTVTRLTKNASSITFYTSGGVVTVNKFQEGSSVGVYTSLAVTQAINFQAVAGGIETKHIFPWGTQAGTPGSYDIGTNDERFNTAYLSGANIKPAGQSVGMSPLLTKILSGYPGLVHSDGTDSNWLRTPLNGIIPYASGGASALGSSAWPFNNGYFKSLNVAGPISGTTIDTGHGANEVYKITNELLNGDYTAVSMSTMDITEIRFVCAYLESDDDGSPRGSVKLPAGGTYVVVNSSGTDVDIRFNDTYTPTSPVYHPGGYELAYAGDGNRGLAMFIVRRIS